MSDRIVQSYYGCHRRSGQSMHSYQSVWMARWTQTSSNASPQIENCLTHPFECKEDDCDGKQLHLLSGAQVASDISGSAKGCGQTETQKLGILNENLTMSTKIFRNEESGCQPSPVNQCGGSTSVSKNEKDTCLMEPLRSEFKHNLGPRTPFCASKSYFSPAMASLGVNHLQPVGNLQNLVKPVRSQILLGDRRSTDSRPLQDDFTGSVSHFVPYKFVGGGNKFDGERNALPSFMCRNGEVNQLEHVSNTNPTILKHEDCIYPGHSNLLVCEKERAGCSNTGRSEAQYLRLNNIPKLPHDPSSSNKSLPAFSGREYQRILNYSGMRLFPSPSSPPKMNKPEMLHHGYYFPQKIPHSVQDEDTMRICTKMDSVEEIPRGPSRYYQTTQSLLITKRNDAKLGKENQNLGESSIPAQFGGSSVSQPHRMSALNGSGQRVKLQLLSSPTGSEKKENANDIKATEGVLRNESSAETDTMDVDAFKENNQLSGEYCSSSKKDKMVDPDPPPQVGWNHPITELPDINVELPCLPAPVNSMENAEPSTSRTQSLDMELLLSHAEQPCNSKSIHCPGDPVRSDPSSRWVKRLKLSASDYFAPGSNSSNFGEASSHDKVNKFNRIIKSHLTNSEPILGNRHGKELMALDQTSPFEKNGESSSIDVAKQGQNITLSHFWIRRWLHNQVATPKKLHKTESSKVALEEFQKKQFPSIAAMALMGKAMSGFQPCEFQKKGSFVVWNNTKAF